MIDFDNAVVAGMLKAKEIGVKMLASDCEAILEAAIASTNGDPIGYVDPVDVVRYDEYTISSLRTSKFTEPLFRTSVAAASKIAEQQAAIARLKNLSVTNIMLEISPGFDGMGEEIYAKSVEDVEKAMHKLAMRIDDNDSTIQAQRQEIARLKKELEEACKVPDGYAQIATRVINHLKFLNEAIKRCENQFRDEKFGVEWHDAADDCKSDYEFTAQLVDEINAALTQSKGGAE